MDDNDSVIGKRNVSFNDIVYYYYIETKEELLDADLKKDMWWTVEEMNYIRAIYTIELEQFMKAYPKNNIRNVQKQLWLVFDFDEIYRLQNNP